MSSNRASGGTSGASASDHAITNALMLIGALGWGICLLVQKGRLTWPPTQFLASMSTIAGCLALVGPVVLARSGGKGGSLGELLWLTGGLLVWIFDIAAAVQGQARAVSLATPLGDRTMGLTILAVMIAGLRGGLAGKDWTWTNVTGWSLGLFWVGMALGSWVLPPGWYVQGLVSR